MGILDQIANPRGVSFLENLKIVDMMEQRQHRRTMDQIQAGTYLMQMRKAKAEADARAKGLGYIRQKLGGDVSRETQSNRQQTQAYQQEPQERVEGDAFMPGEDQQVEGDAYQPSKDFAPAVAEFTRTKLSGLKTEDIAKAETFDELFELLAGMPEMQEEAKMFGEMAETIRARAAEETEQQREITEQVMEIIGDTLQQASALEDEGKPEEAKQIYEQTISRVKRDPRFADIQELQETIQAFGEYEPGLGKYMFLTSRMSEKSREQQGDIRLEQEKQEGRLELEKEKQRNRIDLEELKIKGDKEVKNLDSFKSADARAIYAMAVGYHGGIFDEAGNVKMLNPDLTKDVQELSMKAAQLFNEGKANTHNEAISMAAEDLNFEEKIPQPTNQEEYDALPSGTKFKNRSGKIETKP